MITPFNVDVPTDVMKKPTDVMKTPTDVMKTPTDVMKTPTHQSRLVVCPPPPRKHHVIRRLDPVHYCEYCRKCLRGCDYQCDACGDIITMLTATTIETPDICFVKIDFDFSEQTIIRKIFPVPRSFAMEGNGPQIKYFIPSIQRWDPESPITCKIKSVEWFETPTPQVCDSLEQFLEGIKVYVKENHS